MGTIGAGVETNDKDYELIKKDNLDSKKLDESMKIFDFDEFFKEKGGIEVETNDNEIRAFVKLIRAQKEVFKNKSLVDVYIGLNNESILKIDNVVINDISSDPVGVYSKYSISIQYTLIDGIKQTKIIHCAESDLFLKNTHEDYKNAIDFSEINGSTAIRNVSVLKIK